MLKELRVASIHLEVASVHLLDCKC